MGCKFLEDISAERAAEPAKFSNKKSTDIRPRLYTVRIGDGCDSTKLHYTPRR